MELLLQAGADPNERDSNKIRPYKQPHSHVSCVKLLLEAGVSLDAMGGPYLTA